ncbi:uncharacterized protein LOC124128726 isoform X1 [Haliotis rufescens]|uniref:uncharacterized protein LOC124128726 isoform X1 n=1 Tax=Haliotis rufescens TaxID=6454 RepID=UPI00201F15B5|nr:uncharacterized protein LOC124128726 isoform X1 [Haliotis rufescens]
MFIETLEFTIPVELCNVFSTLQKGQRSNVEFPASVNSYGTTQDASVQVVLRSNKLTFKVDGVSSNASMISKSECKTLKLSVFDVDRTLMPQENDNYDSNNMSAMQHSTPVSFPSKRHQEISVSQPPAKNRRTSFSESPRPRSPLHRRSQPQISPRPSQNTQSKSKNDSPVNVKQEPEDPDLIEIELDHDPDDVVPKKETPYMQIDYSSDVPHTQTSQAALDRLSHPQSSHSQSPGSSSSSFHQNVPHVPDYAEPSTSQVHHGDQSADDFLVFQEQDEDCDDNDADYGNDGDGNSLSFSECIADSILIKREEERGHEHMSSQQFPDGYEEGTYSYSVLSKGEDSHLDFLKGRSHFAPPPEHTSLSHLEASVETWSPEAFSKVHTQHPHHGYHSLPGIPATSSSAEHVVGVSHNLPPKKNNNAYSLSLESTYLDSEVTRNIETKSDLSLPGLVEAASVSEQHSSCSGSSKRGSKKDHARHSTSAQSTSDELRCLDPENLTNQVVSSFFQTASLNVIQEPQPSQLGIRHPTSHAKPLARPVLNKTPSKVSSGSRKGKRLDVLCEDEDYEPTYRPQCSRTSTSFTCTECGQTFTLGRSLNRHRFNVHGLSSDC